MQPERFDLNDIQHEPTDEQLEALMTSVAMCSDLHFKPARPAFDAILGQE
jgi:hypothetical protein